MDIYTAKRQLDSRIQSDAAQVIVNAEQAWNIFKEFVRQEIEDENCEEFGFSVCAVSSQEGRGIQGKNLFQVYFGRLIDSTKGSSWQTAEIDFYFRFEMSAELRNSLERLQTEDMEAAFCRAESESQISQKRNRVFVFADEKEEIWQAIRGVDPVLSSYHFWIR